MVPPRYLILETMKVSNRSGETGGVYVAWRTATKPSDSTNNQADTDGLESVIGRVTETEQSNMKVDVDRNVFTDGMSEYTTVMAL